MNPQRNRDLKSEDSKPAKNTFKKNPLQEGSMILREESFLILRSFPLGMFHFFVSTLSPKNDKADVNIYTPLKFDE